MLSRPNISAGSSPSRATSRKPPARSALIRPPSIASGRNWDYFNVRANGDSSRRSARSPHMLRTRLYLGLLPLLLLIVATGGYAIHRVRNLSGSLSRDLVNNYRAVLGCQQMRTSATLMTSALSPAMLGDGERRAFEEHRAAFKRELT